ncbi:hypothetical protein OH77DRAFT_1492845 [Trametes cingulata]|nr:hypothetical protein OH77DRAFT_1492845 [Trametes cingulata]
MPGAKRITLYGATDSPFPHRLGTLSPRGGKATYDVIWIDLVAKPDWYEKKVNPAGGKVPFLVYGGPELHPDEEPAPEAAKIPESLVILQFLDEVFPDAHLLPADLVLRAQARLFFIAVDNRLIDAFVGLLFRNEPAENILAILEELQAKLPPTGYVVGDWSIADAAFTPVLSRLVLWLKCGLGTFKPDVGKAALDALESPRFARLHRYIEDNMARPSMVKTWDENAANAQVIRRIERLRKTGIFSSDKRYPIPSTD